MTHDELDAAVAAHQVWMQGGPGGACANLSGAVLGGVNLGDANLRGADLHGATLHNCNLGGANLSGANLSDTQMENCNLSNVNLSGANLRGRRWRNVNTFGANLAGATGGGLLASIPLPHVLTVVIAAFGGLMVAIALLAVVPWIAYVTAPMVCPSGYTTSDVDISTRRFTSQRGSQITRVTSTLQCIMPNGSRVAASQAEVMAWLALIGFFVSLPVARITARRFVQQASGR